MRQICRTILFSAPILAVASCSSTSDPDSDPKQIYGTWIVTEGTVLGDSESSEEEWGMSLTFSPNEEMTWRFNTSEGVETYEETYRIDASVTPKQIDLMQPGVSGTGETALGIYKIEGERLTITMGAQRPKDFTETTMARMVLRRQR